MPRYHFHINNGAFRTDEEGTDLPGMEEARLVADRLVDRLSDRQPTSLQPGHEWSVEVTDDSEGVLYRLFVFATASLEFWPPNLSRLS